MALHRGVTEHPRDKVTCETTHAQFRLQHVWRKVYPDPESLNEVGLTREHRRIDRIFMSPRVSDLVKTAHTIPVGGSDHLAVVAKICPSMQFKPSNVLAFPPHVLQEPEFLQGMENIFEGK